MLFRGRVLDVSVGGCYIETEAKLKLAPGTPVEMVFRVNDRVFRCDAGSRVILEPDVAHAGAVAKSHHRFERRGQYGAEENQLWRSAMGTILRTLDRVLPVEAGGSDVRA